MDFSGIDVNFQWRLLTIGMVERYYIDKLS